ncbi:hypothetical protein [Amedibacterium intestinale]|uniref:hypothetical protein n=1 Tax=Amedibacterium intestinale TaxID=2583452 RepID=UPI000E208611|nr:hypothetical protein [Amedibacterium intestinale]RHO30484.1 hypothetical protein DW208_05345 [Erysipelotrichaceae bacterium AM17-60]BBK63437.1 hypothetical protein A9CBEGH2_23770 [Amedibacterium intestinale]
MLEDVEMKLAGMKNSLQVFITRTYGSDQNVFTPRQLEGVLRGYLVYTEIIIKTLRNCDEFHNEKYFYDIKIR